MQKKELAAGYDGCRERIEVLLLTRSTLARTWERDTMVASTSTKLLRCRPFDKKPKITTVPTTVLRVDFKL